MIDLAAARERMVERQIARRGVRDRRVLQAMREVPREAFVPERLREFAYEDSPLPIEAGQTISQPYIVGLMIEAAEIRSDDRVLEVGAGSGYAAAVLARVGGRVHAIERHGELARLARERLAALGYDNVEVVAGDGSKGWPAAAPFDAILVAAGGPAIPQALKDQLDIGGRLVMPVGDSPNGQRLVKVTRVRADHFEEDDLGAVTFVPLIGEQAWSEDGRRPPEAKSFRSEPQVRSTAEQIAAVAEPLPAIEDPEFAAPFDRFGSARVVLLGEASHGTSEFYRARAAITRRLVERHGFDVVAVEADWPDAASIDRHIRDRPAASQAEPAFRRFPTWMWRNLEVEAFVEELRTINAGREASRRVGFYGLDLYSLSASIEAVLAYLDRLDPEAAAVARQRYGCLTPWAKDPQAYGRMAVSAGFALCESGVVTTLRDMLQRRLDRARDGDDLLDATANARLVKNAEAYYRAMYYGSAESWNLRDTHMADTLQAILDARGPQSKAVVWAHNSHIGDARRTEMGQVREELNIGQLCRERFGADAALIGFGTHGGAVACADDWDQPMQVKTINPSRPDSIERLAHDSGLPRFLLDLGERMPGDLKAALAAPQLQRFIGVIYRPETERWSHYSECELAGQFDAYVWFDQTGPVTPLGPEPRTGVPDTYPFGL